MDIVGGIYVETCETPSWIGLWGSGLRAALAASSLGHKVTLHSYASEAVRARASIDPAFVSLSLRPRKQEIAFAYFHPLSDPFVEPPVATIGSHPPIAIEAQSVLRFGLLEGSARVTADRAVYDPQSPRSPDVFGANGSVARELALVMNEHEFYAYSKCSSTDDGVRKVFGEGEASVVVIKRGVHGATVYSATGISYIPPYQSRSVFKIGTGDVFSAVFALRWAKEQRDAVEAADFASRAVSVYCSAPRSPLSYNDIESAIAYAGSVGAVEVIANADTIGRRYTLQEALHSIRKLGIAAHVQATDKQAEGRLVLLDGLSAGEIARWCAEPKNTVVLDEEARLSPGDLAGALLCRDFASAIYQVCMKRA